MPTRREIPVRAGIHSSIPFFLRLALGLFICAPGLLFAARPLQELIDATPAGGVLKPAPGTYSGPALISRPMTLDGQGKVTLTNGGKGTVLVLRSDGATIRGLRITGTGESQDAVDAALVVEGNDNRVEDNRIDDALFGVVLKQANRSVVRGNRISSKRSEVAYRGDGIRLWYSANNLIENNEVIGVRDVSFSTSSNNRVAGNVIRDARYSMHFIFSHENIVEKNTISDNETGIIIMHSRDLLIRNNRLLNIMSVSGVGIGFKDTGTITVEGNDIVRCAVGVRSDSPTNPATKIFLRGNRFAHNTTALVFYGERGGHVVTGNKFEHNLANATVFGTGDRDGNEWRGNYWDDYQGFDADNDGVGDTPHEVHAFADRIWMETPMATFFRRALVLDLLDFLERLAPFSQPDLFLRDGLPRISKGRGGR